MDRRSRRGADVIEGLYMTILGGRGANVGYHERGLLEAGFCAITNGILLVEALTVV